MWKADRAPRWYRCDETGARARKTDRPMDYSSDTWNSMSYKAQCEIKAARAKEKAEAQAYLDIVVADSPPGGGSSEEGGGAGSAAPEGGSPAACAPIGLLGLSPALVARVAHWKRKTQAALVELCTDYREVQSAPGLAEQPCADEQPPPWDAWGSFIDATDAQRTDDKRKAVCMAAQIADFGLKSTEKAQNGLRHVFWSEIP